jgi:RNA polymerase sigma-54 factor
MAQRDDQLPDPADYKDFSIKNAKDLQKGKDFQESILTKPQSLADYLLWQTRFLDFSDEDFKIAEEIIGNIDESGYLMCPLEEIAANHNLSPVHAENVLKQIHELEPPGIGARNLQEALLIQLKKKGEKTLLAQKIVGEFLPLLEKRDWQHLAKSLNVPLGEVREAVSQITRLEPKPGRTFYVEEPIVVVPDASIYWDDEEEKLMVEVHDESVPEIRISPYYKKLLRDKHSTEETKAFLKEKIQSAYNLIKSLQLRKSTIREITEAIVKEQGEFFLHGFSQLKPLRLKDIAGILGIHESTVSRALQGKYVSTPQGTIPYKSFFSTRLDTADGQDESQKSIMEKIKSLIAKENPAKPLSDEEIVTILKNEGVQIARRTIAKYRDILKILPSYLRRIR